MNAWTNELIKRCLRNLDGKMIPIPGQHWRSTGLSLLPGVESGDEVTCVRAYFWESAYTALSNADNKVRLRAGFQVAQYCERLRGLHQATSSESDMVTYVRNSLEDLIG